MAVQFTMISSQFFILVLLSTVCGQKCQGQGANPGVYNFEIGGRPAKVIADGRFAFPVEDAFLSPPFLVKRALKLNFQATSPMIFEINVLFVDLGPRKVLFDTGTSFLALDPNQQGFLAATLAREGIARNSITDVFITHSHFDHIGGLLLSDGKTSAFPRATIHFNAVDFNFWTQENVPLSRSDLPLQFQPLLIDAARQVLPAIRKQVKLFRGCTSFLGGQVRAIPETHHTQGHTTYKVVVGKDQVLFAGDSFGVVTTSINNPWFRSRFDFNGTTGVVGRVKLLDNLASSKTVVIPYHATFPALGRVVANGFGFDFKSVNYEWMSGVSSICQA